MTKIVKLAIGVVAGTLLASTLAQAASPNGVWRTPSGWKVKVYQCGAAFCGKVIGGVKGKDVHNPNKVMQNRAIVGIRMIWGMKKSGSKYTGKLYNPKDGKTYTGQIKEVTASSMNLGGCVFGGLICKSQTWRK